MNTWAKTSAVIIALTLVTGTVGGWLGVRYGLRAAQAPQGLDELIHERLQLSSAQDQQLHQLEADYAARRAEFEQQMRAANRDISRAITERHRYDAEAQASIDRLHQAMIGLQAITVQHVLAMRELLTPDQARQFDETVNQALAVSSP